LGRLIRLGMPDPCRSGPVQAQEPTRPDGRIGDRTSIAGTFVSVGAAEEWASRRGNEVRAAPWAPTSAVAAAIAHCPHLPAGWRV